MPERIWAYECCGVTAGAISCPTCGGPGEFSGWGLTVPEALERYRRAYGLEPMGPHLELAKEVFEGLRRECDRCGGTGLEGDVYEWRHCTRCEGGGGVWTASEDAIRAAWRRVLHFHPAAAVAYQESPWAGVPWDPTATAATAPWTPEAREAFAAYQREVHRGRDGGSLDHGGRSASVVGSWRACMGLGNNPKLRRLEALRRRRRAARRRPKGYSIHGLRHTDVQQAFVEAERRLGVHWPLKGRGHCRRATLAPSYARTVARVARSGEVMNPEFSRGWLQLYPLPIIEEAARILGVTPWILVGQEY
jgi:hypothetical protein